MALSKEQAWFPAKRYGYGWGIPTRWQGWLVVLGCSVALLGPTSLLSTPTRTVVYFMYAILLTMLLVTILMWKGEKLRGRWGDNEEV
jgi:hypothetical protein